MNIDDDRRIEADMINSLNRAVDIIKMLEILKVTKHPDPVEFIIALSTYAEFCKQDLIKNITETNVILERNPNIKRFIDQRVRKEMGDEAVNMSESITSPKEARATIDRITEHSTELILKKLDNKTIYEKINALLKRFDK